MQTRTDEIADGIYRFSTYLPDVAAPAGFTVNQFLIDAEEPLLYHCGMRSLFPLVSVAVGRIVPLARLQWIGFAHLESDESGSMNQWLAAAPHAQIAHGALGCEVSINDLADRPPRALTEGEVIDLGGKRVRHLDTPHTPHGWDSRVLFEETTRTLLCGDVLSQVGNRSAVTESDILEPAIAAEEAFGSTSLGPHTAPALRRLADLDPHILAIMHGSSYAGDGAAVLHSVADYYDQRLRAALA
ncbi:MAG: MBL fold metallo-hydrolase [Actinomycetota bacterium]|nr:MBL fold metallo-hydrolase [Actinomycetota bacterium]